MEVMRPKVVVVKGIPESSLAKLPAEMKRVFDLERAFRELIRFHLPSTKSEWEAIQNCMGEWDIAMHWCYRMKYDSKHKIPVARNHALFYKDLGIFICSILELAIQCHAWASPESEPYINAGEWFHCIMQDFKMLEIRGLTEGINSKHDAIKTERIKIEAICGSSKSDAVEKEVFRWLEAEQPHFHRLIQRAISIRDKNLNNDIWKRYVMGRSKEYPGLITAWKRWTTFQEKNCHTLMIRDGAILYQTGKGRSIKRVELRGAAVQK